MTHAARPLQSHDLSGEGIKLWITYMLFDHTRTWRASPDEWSAQCRGHLRDSTNMKDNTRQAHTQSSQQGEYGIMITTAKWYSGTLGGLNFPDICLTGEEKPRKNLTQETCPDRGSNPGPLRARMLLAPQRWTRLIINNWIISARAYSLYWHPGSNFKLFKYVRVYQERCDNEIRHMAPDLKSSGWQLN